MADPSTEEDDYLEEVVNDAPLLFASSEAVLTIEDPNLHAIGKAVAVFLLFTCMLGFLNGLDYASPDQGLVQLFRTSEALHRGHHEKDQQTFVF